ncbi:MAG: hypothetical protein V4469_03800 [Patescibacteria group bacterium]
MKPGQVLDLISDLINNQGMHTNQIMVHHAGLRAVKLRFGMLAALQGWFGSQIKKSSHELTDKWNIEFSVFTEIALRILRAQHVGFNLPQKYAKKNHVAVLKQWCGVCARVARGDFRVDYRLQRKPRKCTRR